MGVGCRHIEEKGRKQHEILRTTDEKGQRRRTGFWAFSDRSIPFRQGVMAITGTRTILVSKVHIFSRSVPGIVQINMPCTFLYQLTEMYWAQSTFFAIFLRRMSTNQH